MTGKIWIFPSVLKYIATPILDKNWFCYFFCVTKLWFFHRIFRLAFSIILTIFKIILIFYLIKQYSVQKLNIYFPIIPSNTMYHIFYYFNVFRVVELLSVCEFTHRFCQCLILNNFIKSHPSCYHTYHLWSCGYLTRFFDKLFTCRMVDMSCEKMSILYIEFVADWL